jgi:hypothetical protein
MGGAVPPLPQYAFTAWCSVGRSTGTASLMTEMFSQLVHARYLNKEIRAKITDNVPAAQTTNPSHHGLLMLYY